jgi:hypothetical protein
LRQRSVDEHAPESLEPAAFACLVGAEIDESRVAKLFRLWGVHKRNGRILAVANLPHAVGLFRSFQRTFP